MSETYTTVPLEDDSASRKSNHVTFAQVTIGAVEYVEIDRDMPTSDIQYAEIPMSVGDNTKSDVSG